MLLMVHGKVQLYIPTEQAGDGYDYISWAGVAKTGGMVYYSISENYGNGPQQVVAGRDEVVQAAGLDAHLGQEGLLLFGRVIGDALPLLFSKDQV